MAKKIRASDSTLSKVRHVRIFVASPGDVSQERKSARAVIERLGKDPAFRNRMKIDPILWDDPEAPAPMLANLTPQESVTRGLVRPSDCEIVVTIFWSRMGTPLEKPLKKGKTLYLSGTEWEFEDARRGKRDILLYRRLSSVLTDVDDPTFKQKRAQKKLVEQFFQSLKGPRGGWRSGYTTYDRLKDFSRILEADLRNLLTKLPAGVGKTRVGKPSSSMVSVNASVTGSFRKPQANQRVPRSIECVGIVSGMRPGLSLWLVVEVGDLLWPKEAAVLPDKANKWKATIFEDGATNKFSLSLLVADADPDRRLHRWLELGRKTGKYRELRGIPGTRRLARVDGLRLAARR